MNEFEKLKGILKDDWSDLGDGPVPDDKVLSLIVFHVILHDFIRQYKPLATKPVDCLLCLILIRNSFEIRYLDGLIKALPNYIIPISQIMNIMNDLIENDRPVEDWQELLTILNALFDTVSGDIEAKGDFLIFLRKNDD